jgi:hemerythrin-like domain-containing protein
MTATSPNPEFDLGTRLHLPAEFQLILADYPREGWQAHPDFNGLAAFWLDRHLDFRQVLARLRSEAEARIDGSLAPEAYAARLQRVGSQFLNGLIGHHQIEDDAYFPELARLEPGIARGFDMLDADHHALHDLIDGFAEGGNAVLMAANAAAGREAAGAFHAHLGRFQSLLARHLDDEEDLVLPVVLKHRMG